MPRSTVSAAVRHLLESRVVEEYACADSTGGRRPTKLRVAPAVGNAFVAELGQHHARLAIASREGELLATDDIKINIEIGPEKTIKALAKGWHKLGDEIPGAVVSAGLAVPGPVDGSGHVVGAARMLGGVAKTSPACWHRNSRCHQLSRMTLVPRQSGSGTAADGTGTPASTLKLAPA